MERYPNEFSIKECLAKIYTKLDSPGKCKERPGRIHLLSTSNRLFRRNYDISEFSGKKICPDFLERWLLAFEMWNLVRYNPLWKIEYWYHRHSHENVRNTSDNWKISKLVSFGKISLSATYNLFMVSLLNSIYSPAKPIVSPTPSRNSCRNARIYGTHPSLYSNTTL